MTGKNNYRVMHFSINFYFKVIFVINKNKER
jgi:hypothetical protein